MNQIEHPTVHHLGQGNKVGLNQGWEQPKGVVLEKGGRILNMNAQNIVNKGDL